ncbi:MAG TPA: hypothetical protein VGF79_11385 [Bacteroidia bacterium]
MGAKDFNNVVTPPKIAGIKAGAPFYHLAWQINKSFSIELALNLDWTKQVDEITTSLHKHYFYRFEDVELNWHLVQNKGSDSYFFQTKPLFDYLLVCNGDDIYGYFERAIEAIKSNRKIEFIHPFDFNLVKSKEAFFNNILKTKSFIEDNLHVQGKF